MSSSSSRSALQGGKGIPRKCRRCGEESVMRTSETQENPGRLFYCCPYGSKKVMSKFCLLHFIKTGVFKLYSLISVSLYWLVQVKGHLFKWTDEAMVKEMEEVKSVIERIQESCEKHTSEAQRYQTEVEELKSLVSCCEKEIRKLRSMKNMTVCGFVVVFVYFFYSLK